MPKPTIKIAPSILSADFSCLDREIKKAERAGADMLHIDVMDGHFVPNITIGPVVVRFMRKVTRLPLDVHLMIQRPQKYIDAFVKAGADLITVHIEAISHSEIKRQSLRLKSKGIKFGVSLNPHTSVGKIKAVLRFIDFVLVMSVNPGFGGQQFMPVAIQKIKQLRKLYLGDIAVDGGINDKNAKEVVRAGANILAAGSYIFGAKDAKKAIERLKSLPK
jgi:ribulose-phosphate 3-epimerase